MNNLQKTLLSVGIIIAIIIVIYLLISWFMRSRKKTKAQRMLTMNLIIKYKPFMEYLKYQMELKEKFNVFLLKINNLSLIELKHPQRAVQSYLTMIAKELSVYVPFGGKVAQTKFRDTFIIYYPLTSEDMNDVGERFKSLALKTFHKKGITISMTNSVAYIDNDNYSSKNLIATLYKSVQDLGLVTKYSKEFNNTSNYLEIIKNNNLLNYETKSLNISKIKDPTYQELYNVIKINGTNFNNFLKKYPLKDQAWLNMNIIENIVNTLYEKNIYSNINLPIYLNTLEKDEFNDYLQHIVASNSFNIEQIILSIKITHIDNDDLIIKNILNLSNLGVKISLDLNYIEPKVYQVIQKYKIDRLEVNDELFNSNEIDELLYYAKVNHLEVLLKTNNANIDNAEQLNVSHITKEIINYNNDEKRGRR